LLFWCIKQKAAARPISAYRRYSAAFFCGKKAIRQISSNFYEALIFGSFDQAKERSKIKTKVPGRRIYAEKIIPIANSLQTKTLIIDTIKTEAT